MLSPNWRASWSRRCVTFQRGAQGLFQTSPLLVLALKAQACWALRHQAQHLLRQSLQRLHLSSSLQRPCRPTERKMASPRPLYVPWLNQVLCLYPAIVPAEVLLAQHLDSASEGPVLMRTQMIWFRLQFICLLPSLAELSYAGQCKPLHKLCLHHTMSSVNEDAS